MKRESDNQRSPLQGLHLLLIQSITAIFAVGIVLLLKFVGGDVYDELVMYFRSAMLENTVFAAQYPEVPAVATTSVVAPTLSIPSEAADEKPDTIVFTAPLTGGVVTSSYGVREDPLEETTTAMHEGVDIAAPFETPLAALTGGTVKEVGYEDSGYGHYVLVAYGDDCEYLYAHCSAIGVEMGERVEPGETIAFVGSTGRSTGNHVHIEYRCGGEPQDPMLILPDETYV